VGAELRGVWASGLRSRGLGRGLEPECAGLGWIRAGMQGKAAGIGAGAGVRSRNVRGLGGNGAGVQG